jgi:hypothetical protein
VPSMGAVYTEGTAPGLSTQPAYVQFGEGVRLTPELPARFLRLNYLAEFQQFYPPSSSTYAFRRLLFDLNHEIPLYTLHRGGTGASPAGGTATGANSGEEGAVAFAPRGAGSPGFGLPPVSPTKDLTGSISVRLLIEESTAKAGSSVPFYFQPTLGGSDIDGQTLLASYPDYRFRAPNLMVLRGSFEQSLGRKIPAGVFFSYEEGKVGTRRDDVVFDHMRHTFTAGVTIHAGGLPVVYVLFAWGGEEGHHTTAFVSQALLGSGGRPSLF